MKNEKCLRAKTARMIPCKRRFALTGTPMSNEYKDLWSLFDFLNPGLLGSAKAFGKLCKAMAKRTEARRCR